MTFISRRRKRVTVGERIIFERILCPVDLTSESEESLRYAIALAKAYEAQLFVINCIDSYAAAGPRARQPIEELIDIAVRKHLRLPSSIDFHWEALVVDGDPQTAIAQEAAKRRVDLIVMRSRRRPYAAALLGSTAESICRTAPCPVLITHQDEHSWAGFTTNEIGLKRVLVAYDFSGDSELALSYGVSLSQEYQAQLHVLHVLPAQTVRSVSTGSGYVTRGDEYSFRDVASSFRDAASRLHCSVPPETRVWCEIKQALREGQPYREVLSYAEEQSIDLICMGASGTGFGMRALFGSNVDRVLRQAPCPVLIARPLRPAIAAITA
jgi:nucleotide-binding universal stress UspA family protein